MSVDEARARLAQVDARLVEQLRALGLTHDEIELQLDRSRSREERARDLRAALERHAVAQAMAMAAREAAALRDPATGLVSVDTMRELAAELDAAAPETRREAMAIAAAARAATEKRQRRAVVIRCAVLAAVVVGAGAWYVLSQGEDPPSPCTQMLQPLGELEQAIGTPLQPRPSRARGSGCSQDAWTSMGVALSVEVTLEDRRGALDLEEFASKEPFVVDGAPSGWLYAVTEARVPTDAELANARRTRPHSADPVGDLLANAPPSSYTLLVPLRDRFAVVEIDASAASLDRAKAVFTLVARRARAL
jgi:hypothetical protein